MNYFGESIAIILSIAYYFNGPLQKCQVKEKKSLGMLITMVTLPNWRKETSQVQKAWGPKGLGLNASKGLKH
jgi:hypothetical protein